MKYFKIKSHAKLNLALNVIGKTASLHKIETIVSFASLHDEIFIKKIKSKSHNIIFTGKFSKNINKNNTVSKLLQILENRKLMGATDPTKADEGTIRKKYGISIDKNSVHGSDSSENAKIEIDFFFKD